MRPDFSRIWGSDNAPFTPIEASDYAAGWVFRTGAPPRRVNFDYFQNLSDLRHEWLGEQMLLAVGHEWQSDVSYNLQAYTRSPVNGKLYKSLDAVNLGNEPSATPLKWREVPDLSEPVLDYLNTARIDVASASTVNLSTAAPNTRHIRITGSVAITGFTVAVGQTYLVTFSGATTLTNNAAIVTNRGANIPVASGDSCWIRATAENTVEVVCGSFLYEAAVGTRGQTWQNLTASRVHNTLYTNTTGRAILVNATIASSTGTTSLEVGGVIAASCQDPTSVHDSSLSAIVPAGSTYRTTGGGPTMFNWSELR